MQKDDKGDPGGFGRRGAKAYQAALEAVFAIPIALGLGYWADRQFGTAPVLLLVGLALGFVTFVVRLSRMRGLMEESSEEERDEK
jgi:F0F1-type ATP synthase assembly protein I